MALLSRKLLGATALCITVSAIAAPEQKCVGTNSNVALSSIKMSDTPFVYQAGFNTGSLTKRAIQQSATGDITIARESIWDAGRILTAQSPAKRTVATMNAITKQTVPFALENLPLEVQTQFHLSPGTQTKDGLGKERIDYLLGDRTMEASTSLPRFRIRESVLGDIINSAPVYVGAPKHNNIGSNFQSFYEQHRARAAAVYIGANDCMLHAFSANSGTEIFAYIPTALLTTCPKLTRQHVTSMDGKIGVAEALVFGTWKTVLAAGMGLC